MNQTITRLMQENLLAVFNERDAQRRLDVVRRNYTEDARWADAEETVVGQDRLHEKAQALLDGPLAGLSFVEAGPRASGGEHGGVPGLECLRPPARTKPNRWSPVSTSRSSRTTVSRSCSPW